MEKNKRFTLERKILFIRAAAVLILVVMMLLLLAQTVFAETTYVITDGSRVLVHTTSQTDPQIVLGEAGLELDTNDTYTTHTDSGVSNINVRRRQRLYINYHGRLIEAYSNGETVEQLLARLELPWEEADMLSHPPQSGTYDGMKLTVAHVDRQEQIYTAALPHETIYCSDANLPAGTERILTAGTDGQLLCRVKVTYVNGEERERTMLEQQVVSRPVNEVVALGTGCAEAPAGQMEEMASIGDGIITLPTGEVLTYTEKVSCLATAYHCEGYVGRTATGTRARVGAIAVDPEVFPYGTRFYIVTRDGEYIYGVATAEDCGDKRFIYGTRLDLFFDTKYECVQFGARMCDVYILG